MNKLYPPFTTTFSREFPEFLKTVGCSLLFSSFQSNKLVVLNSDGEKISLLPRTFDEPYGLALKGDKLAVATSDKIILLRDDKRLAESYPKKDGFYSSLFLPRGVYYTGKNSWHDLVWLEDKLVGVNTTFSTIAEINNDFSFTPIWKPKFISELLPEDRCHLNGLAVDNGKIKYATAFSTTDSYEGWRANVKKSGVLIDVATNEIVLSGLAMPHSPKIFDDELFLVNSVKGEVLKIDTQKGSFDVVCKLPGFVRGIEKVQDYLVVGTSKIRSTHLFGDVTANDKSVNAGIYIVHLPTGAVTGNIEFLSSVEEIYDILLVKTEKALNLLGVEHNSINQALSLPSSTFWAQ